MSSTLHVPYTYFPDPSGGTEVYVHGLVRRLVAMGLPSAIAAPGARSERYEHDGHTVWRFPTDPGPSIEHANGAPDRVAAEGFREILGKIQPAIVHLHARTAAVSDLLIDIAHDAGARVISTYHTPAMSCVRGTMMHLGRTPCDGRLDGRRCGACKLEGLGLPRLLGDALARMPNGWNNLVARAPGKGRWRTALCMTGLVSTDHDRFRGLLERVDHIVAVCRWVEDVLLRNGVPRSKVTLCRQGVDPAGSASSARSLPPGESTALRIAFFGRLDRAKGPDLLVKALRRAPRLPVRVDIYGVRQHKYDSYAEQILHSVSADPRLRLLPAVPPAEVAPTMRAYDLVAIPSRCLETGPLVALEAFSVGVPILGAALGGIAELVRDGVDGVLVPPDTPVAWSNAVAKLTDDRNLLEQLRQGVQPPRTMKDVALEMAALYRGILNGASVSTAQFARPS